MSERMMIPEFKLLTSCLCVAFIALLFSMGSSKFAHDCGEILGESSVLREQLTPLKSFKKRLVLESCPTNGSRERHLSLTSNSATLYNRSRSMY